MDVKEGGAPVELPEYGLSDEEKEENEDGTTDNSTDDDDLDDDSIESSDEDWREVICLIGSGCSHFDRGHIRDITKLFLLLRKSFW